MSTEWASTLSRSRATPLQGHRQGAGLSSGPRKQQNERTSSQTVKDSQGGVALAGVHGSAIDAKGILEYLHSSFETEVQRLKRSENIKIYRSLEASSQRKTKSTAKHSSHPGNHRYQKYKSADRGAAKVLREFVLTRKDHFDVLSEINKSASHLVRK